MQRADAPPLGCYSFRVRDLLSILRCPTCGGALTRESAAHACATCGPFLTTAGQPVLVDFERSILERGGFVAREGASPISRKGAPAALRRLLKGRNAAAERTAAALNGRLPKGALVLVVGGGAVGSGAEGLYAGHLETVGLDIYASPNTRVVADAHDLPFVDESFDAVWIQAVLEHVLDPARVAAEIWRVLRPDGLVFADTPFMQPVHEGGYDFTRFSNSGHRWLFRRFEEIESGVSGGAGSALLWSIRYFIRAVTGSPRLGAAAVVPLFWLRFFDGSSREQADAAAGVYFFGRKSAADLGPADILDFYYGSPPRGR